MRRARRSCWRAQVGQIQDVDLVATSPEFTIGEVNLKPSESFNVCAKAVASRPSMTRYFVVSIS